MAWIEKRKTGWLVGWREPDGKRQSRMCKPLYGSGP